jgi:hypothetical protein
MKKRRAHSVGMNGSARNHDYRGHVTVYVYHIIARSVSDESISAKCEIAAAASPA